MTFDAIVVGARCAGSPLAMLLARSEHRVLLVDRARFPSDTISTHFVHQPGVARLKRWGLYDRVAASGCPPITEVQWWIQGIGFAGTPPPYEGNQVAIVPRRTVLDTILVEAAAEAGAEVRQQFMVRELVFDGDRVVGVRGQEAGGAMVEEKAEIVVGADGVHSFVAKAVGAEKYNEKSPRTDNYYSYWSGIDCSTVELYGEVGEGYGLNPTNGGLTIVITSWTPDGGEGAGRHLEQIKKSSFADRVLSGNQEEKTYGIRKVPNYFRESAGPGWALVGDAGYMKDPITAQGISDAFRDAESLAAAIHDGLTGERSMDLALKEYVENRDSQSLPFYGWTLGLARLNELTEAERQIVEGIAADRRFADRYCGVMAETVRPEDLFAPF